MSEAAEDMRFHRVRRLVGEEAFDALAGKRCIVFGIGGVGGWTAEALVRSGVRDLTIVDADRFAESNINRQPFALSSTIGREKVEVARERLLDINPEAKITALCKRYDSSTAEDFDLESYDYVVDAIDSLKDKALLILNATSARRPKLFSSMGAALKMDPSRVSVAEFWKVKGCPLAAALRNKFKRSGQFPRKKFKAVYSDELLKNLGPDEDTSGAMTFGKAAVNGAMVHITALFGMTLASLVVRDAFAR